jgi:hypothetical protein
MAFSAARVYPEPPIHLERRRPRVRALILVSYESLYNVEEA